MLPIVNRKHGRPLVLELTLGNLLVKSGRRIVRRVELSAPSAKPVVKWPGGKQWLAPAAKYLAPPRWSGRYLEPFLGGGAFYLSLQPRAAKLGDRNPELVTTYQAIRDDAAGVIRLLRRFPHDKEFFYELRDRTPRHPNAIAARFLYLNRTCWNGLYRVNKQGKFNTPFGRFKNPTICDVDRIHGFAAALRGAEIQTRDFGSASSARKGDFVYFDPPYITGHWRNGFLKYNAPLFSWEDQQRLAELALALAKRGVHVLVSNADHHTVTTLYSGLYKYRVRRRSLIGGKSGSRRVISEILLSSYPLFRKESESP